ncbi:Predicted lactoylglutathione lyase [Roseibium suaedae]|uniref:Predicted lactoylglutathione lyase n=1 Tax=Roseibium suaedae TaxID=735517 RepID=A0A1M6Z8Z4_9HYPH|nr:Predicted lactoylglutathione lyase [Roseibium suaedae]
MSIFDHVGFEVSDYSAARAFYDKALAPLGIKVVMEVGPEQTGNIFYCGYGVERPEFWIGGQTALNRAVHVAFAAPNRSIVDAFYAAAIAAGGKDNGAPGLRPHYHENYYGAFVLDPDGHNIEAVCHLPE